MTPSQPLYKTARSRIYSEGIQEHNKIISRFIIYHYLEKFTRRDCDVDTAGFLDADME